MLNLIDSHTHLNMPELIERIDEVISDAQKEGVTKFIIPGVNLEETGQIISLTEKYENLYGAGSVHPQDVDKWNEESYNTLNSILKHPKMVAVGETGLDYYWVSDNKELQKKIFSAHINLAEENNLPLIIHNRDAHADTLEFLKVCKEKKLSGVMHCFSGSAEFALECVKLGFYIGMGGPVTFKNARKPKEVIEKVPIEHILVETDSPYLTPHPYRGKRPNEPKYVLLVAEEIAKIKNLPVETVAQITTQNAQTLFKI